LRIELLRSSTNIDQTFSSEQEIEAIRRELGFRAGLGHFALRLHIQRVSGFQSRVWKQHRHERLRNSRRLTSDLNSEPGSKILFRF